MVQGTRAKQSGQENLWSQLPEENTRQYEKFCAYRDMRYTGTGKIQPPDPTVPRSLRALAERFQSSRQSLETLSRQNRWVERAEAYDSFMLEQIRQKNESEILRMRELHASVGRQMITKAAKRLLALPEEEISPGDLVRLIEAGAKLERLSRGETTENQRISGSVEVGSRPDLSRLTDDDLRRLAALGGDSGHGHDS